MTPPTAPDTGAIRQRLEDCQKRKGISLDYTYPNAPADIAELLAEVERLEGRVKFFKDACIKMNHEVCQSLGKALGFPWFKDDQKNFPGATEADGICEGDQVAESMADMAAKKITRLQSALSEAQARVERMRSALDKIANGEVPDETKREWLGLSEEAYYEAYSEWFQEQAKEALQSTPPTAVGRVIEAARAIVSDEWHSTGRVIQDRCNSLTILALANALRDLDGGRKE